MIKLPKEIADIMKKLSDGGFENYAVGDCVRKSLLGDKPYGWDIATSAGISDLVNLFPEAEIISEKYGVIRLSKIEEMYDKDGEFLGEDGVIADISTYRRFIDSHEKEAKIFTDNIYDDLARRDFTIDAIAINPQALSKVVVDPYDGREDLKKKIIKTVENPNESFFDEPIRMMKAIRLAAELGFDLSKNVYVAIKSNYKLLEKVHIDKLRDEFTALVSAPYAGKGLNMIMDTGIINIILGSEVVEKLTRREKNDLLVLSQNIDKTKQVPERRLGLFYACVDKKKAMPSIDKFNYDPKTYQHLVDAVHDMAKLYFTAQKPDLKKFIYDRDMERYEYLANLEKAQRIVFDYNSETKIRSKIYLLSEVRQHNEPIFVEDLVIDANDLIEAGICSEENAGQMLKLLIEHLHQKPNLNNRAALLQLAKKYKRNKLAALTRKVKWLR